jgi:DUF2075 family protein
MNDIGRSEEIEIWANRLGAKIHFGQLESQFRCNGSDGYIAWLDNMLGIRPTANLDIKELAYDFQVMDSPNELQEKIVALNSINNRARTVAGYCWPWNSKKDKNAMDIVIEEHGFAMQWNLTQDGMLWIISPESVNQIGCIHTCQGLEVDYVGVLMGNDLVIRNGDWVSQSNNRARSDKSVFGMKKLLKENPTKGHEMAELIIKNTYRTLMTRGMKGCFVWSVDEETQVWLKGLVR